MLAAGLERGRLILWDAERRHLEDRAGRGRVKPDTIVGQALGHGLDIQLEGRYALQALLALADFGSLAKIHGPGPDVLPVGSENLLELNTNGFGLGDELFAAAEEVVGALGVHECVCGGIYSHLWKT